MSGMDVNSTMFAVSRPYFEADDEMQTKIDDLIHSYLVGGMTVESRIFEIFQYLFASLCFHAKFLHRQVHKRNKLQASPFFTAIPQFMMDCVTVRYPWDSTDRTPMLTGIPPHISILAQLESVKKELKKNKEEILSGITKELDDCRIGLNSYFESQEVITKMEMLHSEMLAKIEGMVKGQGISMFSNPDGLSGQQGGIDVSNDDLNESNDTPNKITVREKNL